MKKRVVLFSILFAFTFHLHADWIDWTDVSNGSLTDGSSTIDVSMSGMPRSLFDGDYYYNNPSTGYTSETGTYAGLEPNDLIRVSSAGVITINFSQEVVNPYMALVSVGQPNYAVTYNFEDPFNVVSSGPNVWWGVDGVYSVNGTQFSGSEFNGVLQFTGTFSSISFEIANPENWHGFNFGVVSDGDTDDDVTTVPEPSTMLLLTIGIVGFGINKKIFKRA
jgi:hypothetical protein